MWINKINSFLVFISIVFSHSFVLSANPTHFGIKEPISNKERLTVRSLNLTAEDFWSSYLSEDVSQRRYAEMYLSGVLDGSEGLHWCDYTKALPGSIQEQVYIGFKNAPPEEMSLRASTVIVSILSKVLPCEWKK